MAKAFMWSPSSRKEIAAETAFLRKMTLLPFHLVFSSSLLRKACFSQKIVKPSIFLYEAVSCLFRGLQMRTAEGISITGSWRSFLSKLVDAFYSLQWDFSGKALKMHRRRRRSRKVLLSRIPAEMITVYGKPFI